MPLMTWNTSYSVGVAQFDQGEDQKYSAFFATKGVASPAGASA
jgi:hypothetical protein